MEKLTKEVEKEIQEYIEGNQPTVYWESRDFDGTQAKEILEKGMDDFIDNLYEYNMEYIWDLEQYLINEIQTEWDEYDPDEIEEFSSTLQLLR